MKRFEFNLKKWYRYLSVDLNPILSFYYSGKESKETPFFLSLQISHWEFGIEKRYLGLVGSGHYDHYRLFADNLDNIAPTWYFPKTKK